MSIQGGPDIVENGLILCYDPANIESYVSGSTTMYDLSTTGNTASLVGGVAYTGSFKGIFNFDGMNDYINIARPSSISTSGSFSVCMFAKWKTLGTTTSSIQTLLDNNHNSSPVQGFVLQDRPELSKKLSFSVRPDQVGATSSFYVGNNNWYHIAGTHDGTVTRLYINGVLDGFVSQSGGISTVQPNITFGRWQGSSGSRHLRGNIGQTLIYNRSLSLLEIQQNYNAVRGRYPSIAYTPDTNFENVTLLLRGEGDNGGQNNTFIDSSANAFAITRNGNTTQGTFSPYGDNWSNYFDGNGDYLTAPGNSAYDFGTGDWTVEAWFYLTGNASLNNGSTRDAAILGQGTTSALNITLTILGDAATTGTAIQVFKNQNTLVNISKTVTIPQNQWHHVAATKASGTIRVFLNGTQRGTSDSDSTIWGSSVNTVDVGRLPISGYLDYFPGYISNLRVLKGTALYTSNFTPPTSPLTSIANTSLLTCQSNRFRDASSNNFTITGSGNVSVQRFSPFSPNVAYDARTIGGSGYFDGTGDYLTISYTSAFDWWTSDYTIEAWVYANSWSNWSILHNSNNRPCLVGNIGATSLTNWWSFGPNATGKLALYYYNGSELLISSSASVPTSQWNHVAMTKTSAGVTFFINGIAGSPVAFLGTPLSSTSSPLVVGSHNNTSITGYVSNLRIVKGTAVYSSNFTPPTVPVSAITNTSLLLNFTNAAIIDSAMMNNLETVAEAQVETVVTKFGTGALEFDGNGDYLNFIVINGLTLNGDFTVELWFYARSSATQRMFSLYASGTGASYYAGVRIDLNGGPGAFGLWSSDGGNHNIGTYQGSWSLNTWTHLAITRSGNTFRFFKDGTQFYTVDSSHGIMTGTSHTIGMLAGYNADYFNGFIDDFRVTRGIARYTSNFTPPAAALPDL